MAMSDGVEPTAANIRRARHLAAARRNAGRHRSAAARYVPDYQERHMTFTQRCIAEAEAAAKAKAEAEARPKCACCAGTGMAGGMAVAGAGTGAMLAADMSHDHGALPGA